MQGTLKPLREICKQNFKWYFSPTPLLFWKKKKNVVLVCRSLCKSANVTCFICLFYFVPSPKLILFQDGRLEPPKIWPPADNMTEICKLPKHCKARAEALIRVMNPDLSRFGNQQINEKIPWSSSDMINLTDKWLNFMSNEKWLEA